MTWLFGEDEYERHRAMAREVALALAVEEKKLPEAKDVGIGALLKLARHNRELYRLADLRASARLHEVYFASFGETPYVSSRTAREYFGSAASLRDLLYRGALLLECGFVGVGTYNDNSPFVFFAGSYRLGAEREASALHPILPSGVTCDNRRARRLSSLPEIFEVGEPILAIDVYEHAYFDGYGFDKEKYLAAALRRLRIDILDKL